MQEIFWKNGKGRMKMAKIIDLPAITVKFTQDEWDWITACVGNTSDGEIKNYFSEHSTIIKDGFDSLELYQFLLAYSRLPE